MPAVLVPSPAQLVDEFYALDVKVKEFAPKAKRHKELAEIIRSWYDDVPADWPVEAEGILAKVLVSPRTEERSLGLKAKLKICAMIGKAAFVAIAGITLKAATTATSEETVAKLVTTERTGSRKLVAIAKEPARKAA